MSKRHWGVHWAIVAGMVLLAGCGGGGSGAGSPSSAAKEVPTMPAARFAMPTTMITVAPSDTVTATVEAATPTPAAAAADLARGEKLYASKGCAECHGAKGEGVAGKGSAIAGTTLDDRAFEDLMRTGGSGKLGPNHLYGPNAISPSGMEALHAWLQSLPPAP